MRSDTLRPYDASRELEEQIRRMEAQLPAGRLMILDEHRRRPALAEVRAEGNRLDGGVQ